ncbi:Uma2 family endonuclease [Actinomadura sp. HBU206391]|uniref:Uma2 family endonuclease n=1 Tax=Actinomadura sp. HBU206391 TaxID=2731692 RepID=UPI00164F8464|nr:Uma2 family endonuclease [Actinomadura sp. HBU206391]MBC6462329.1 Uma2 family endonuclease [Actinomadura sp. HBU206391]
MADERGWDLWAGTVDTCLPGSRQSARELFTDGLVMVGEVVSPGCEREDREKKPVIFAGGRVPIMILIDPQCDPAQVTVFSEPENGHYTKNTQVDMGKPLHVPEPVDFELDTAIFLERPR